MTDYTYNVQNGKFYCGTATIKGEINDVHNVTNGVRCGKYYYNYYSRPALIGSYVGFARYDSETQETVEMNVMDKLRLSANRSRNTAFIVKPY